MSSYAEEEQDAREYAELQRQFKEEREAEAAHDEDQFECEKCEQVADIEDSFRLGGRKGILVCETCHDGDVVEHDGKTFHFEMLENGLLRTFDYGCQWPLLFKRNENGEWKPENLNARTEAYKGLAIKINETIKRTFGDKNDPLI